MHNEITPMGPTQGRPEINRETVSTTLMLREGSHDARGAYRRAKKRWVTKMRAERPKGLSRRAWNALRETQRRAIRNEAP